MAKIKLFAVDLNEFKENSLGLIFKKFRIENTLKVCDVARHLEISLYQVHALEDGSLTTDDWEKAKNLSMIEDEIEDEKS